MAKRKSTLTSVELRRGETQQSILKRFLKKCKKEKVMEEIYKKGNTKRFVKKSTKLKLKKEEAERRRKAEQNRILKMMKRKKRFNKD